MTTFTQLAFQMRPLCGIISDLLPLFGSRRHSWYFLSCGIAVLCQFMLMLCQKQNVNLIVVLLFAINLVRPRAHCYRATATPPQCTGRVVAPCASCAPRRLRAVRTQGKGPRTV